MFNKKSAGASDTPAAGISDFISIVQGLSEALGQDYCVVLYGLDTNRRGRVVAVANGDIAGLAVGDEAFGADQAAFDEACHPGVAGSLQYFSITSAGRRLRSNLMRIGGATRSTAGFLALHYDLARAELLQDLVARLTVGGLPAIGKSEAGDSSPRTDDLVAQGLQRAFRRLGKPLSYASKVEKIQVVEWLDREGIFLFKGAVEALAQEMGNTKYTIYAYLRETRMRSAD